MDYSKGKVYRIVVGGSHYVGSTIVELPSRLQSHRYMSKRHPHLKIYQKIAEVGWDNVSIELIEDYPCETYKDLLLRERSHIKLDDPLCLNARFPIITEEEGKARDREQHKKWVREHPEARKAHAKKRRDKVRETETPEEMEERRKYQREYMRRRRNPEIPVGSQSGSQNLMSG